MNRSERKREERAIKKQKNTYVFNEHAYQKELEKVRGEMNREIIRKLFGVIMVSLRDEFKWFRNEKYGQKRIDRFIDRFNDNMEAEEQGYTKLNDYNQWCEENGIMYEIKKIGEDSHKKHTL
jgi:hypothetical protein